MNKKVIPPEPSGIQEIPLREALEERYLAYALSTIMHRALPDARDGLKPVHRRILYGMRLLRLDPGAAFKKSAKIVGDVMGNFHPHGDQAIYDALVRLAQDFASRYPLVDGQGNFGNIDGDNPAAYRYTEARLTEVARLLLDGIDEDAVDFRASYDGVMQEPAVLPAAFPNLLANGAQGIAVGMATSIPPHNVAELCDAALYLIEQPNARSKTLLKYVPGPDFPTGGLIVDPPSAIAEAYATGRGSFRLRARWKTEDTGRGTYLIVVTEIPWQVQKMRLVERIAELMNEKKLPFLADMRDKSAEDVRLVFEPRSRSVDPALLMESLFKLTELESRIPLNMNVLIRGRIPKVVGLAEALSEWLAHRRDVLLRRSRYRLAQIEHRLEVLGGYLIAYLNLDKVIKIIRNEDEPKPVLMKTFKLSDVQAEAILNMRLRNLRRLEEMEIRGEEKDLRAEKKSLEELIRSENQQWKKIADEIENLRDKFGPKTPLGKRRTGFAEAPAHDEAAIEEALVEREPITVVVSEKGWIAHCAARSPIFPVSHSRPTTGSSSRSLPRRRRSFWFSPPMAASTPSTPRNCRADAGTASRPGCSSIWNRRRTSLRCSAIRAAASSSSPAARAGVLSWPRTSASPIPARASRCSMSNRRMRLARWRRPKANSSPRSARTANC